jgi:hypothetical protein
MQPPTWEQLVALIGLLGAGIAFLFGKPTLEAIQTFGNWWGEARAKRLEIEAKDRKVRFEEEQQRAIFKREEEDRHLTQLALDEELNDKGHKWIIRRQDRRITELERSEKRCQQDFAVLSTKYNTLEIEHSQIRTEHSQMQSELKTVRERLEILAPGITNTSDSKVARYFQRLVQRRNRKLSESGELDMGGKNEST